MITVIGITADNLVHSDIDLDATDLSAYKWIWADFNEPSPSEVKYLEKTFHFHPLAIEDCLQILQRPKLDYYDDYTFYVTHHVREEGRDLFKEELDFFVSEKLIVTFQLAHSKEVAYVQKQLLTQHNAENWDPYFIFYRILDQIVDNYFPLIHDIEDRLAQLEEDNLNKTTAAFIPELMESRHLLLGLMQTVNPMRDLLYRMLNSQHLEGVRKRRSYFSDIHDDLLKVSEMITSNREVTTDMRDSYLSLNSHQTNNVMKVLTIITSIFSPLTLIAGIYGMNFEHMPELTWKYGYFLAIGLMFGIGLAMYRWFKKSGWF